METEKNTEKQSNFRLIWSFLKGSKALFAVCIISAALMALADMVIPADNPRCDRQRHRRRTGGLSGRR